MKTTQNKTISASFLIVAILIIYYKLKTKKANQMKQNVQNLKLSKKGLNLIKEHEELRLNAYLDPSQPPIWTIGYGHTKNVYPGQKISVSMAEILLKKDVQEAENHVRNRVNVKLNQNQFDALVSHTFNTGGSTNLFKLINGAEKVNFKGKLFDLAQWWKDTYITAGGSGELGGLLRRRKEEYHLFIS